MEKKTEKKLCNKARLAILDRVLESERHDGWYICCLIVYHLLQSGFSPSDSDWEMNDTDCALYHFPELLGYKPEEAPLYGMGGWFGSARTEENRQRRVEVLEGLIAEIEAQTEEEAI
ncbi:MAG: hypothetical protein LBK58_04030 [Prevotellaceae bacterium]|jgi:hypothetical protein|nr:hypothetical protein [Prevotellaceae bacterium]